MLCPPPGSGHAQGPADAPRSPPGSRRRPSAPARPPGAGPRPARRQAVQPSRGQASGDRAVGPRLSTTERAPAAGTGRDGDAAAGAARYLRVDVAHRVVLDLPEQVLGNLRLLIRHGRGGSRPGPAGRSALRVGPARCCKSACTPALRAPPAPNDPSAGAALALRDAPSARRRGERRGADSQPAPPGASAAAGGPGDTAGAQPAPGPRAPVAAAPSREGPGGAGKRAPPTCGRSGPVLGQREREPLPAARAAPGRSVRAATGAGRGEVPATGAGRGPAAADLGPPASRHRGAERRRWPHGRTRGDASHLRPRRAGPG